MLKCRNCEALPFVSRRGIYVRSQNEEKFFGNEEKMSVQNAFRRCHANIKFDRLLR